MKIGHIRENINNDIKRFKENIDYINLKKVIGDIDNNFLFDIGYTKMQISKSECVYLLSERGYAKLVKAMDADRSWDIMDKYIDEYLKCPLQRFLTCESHSKQRITIAIHEILVIHLYIRSFIIAKNE